MGTNKKILFFGIVILVAIFLIGIVITNNQKKEEIGYNFPTPAEVVTQYFTSWNNKDYQNMYATISDGFKKIEPTAKDLLTFKDYAESQKIKNISIFSINEKSNDGITAEVIYSVEFILEDDTTTKYDSTFTLKNRQTDVIRGWKLIHPYGGNIDTA